MKGIEGGSFNVLKINSIECGSTAERGCILDMILPFAIVPASVFECCKLC